MDLDEVAYYLKQVFHLLYYLSVAPVEAFLYFSLIYVYICVVTVSHCVCVCTTVVLRSQATNLECEVPNEGS